jgi:hypothetical protein
MRKHKATQITLSEWTDDLEKARIALCKFWIIIADDFDASSESSARFKNSGEKQPKPNKR